MLRMTRSARRKTRGGLGSALALALTLAGGTVVGAAALSTPALAQNSKDFAKVYQPVADIANAASGDFAAARAQLPAVLAAVQNADDRYLYGNLSLSLGTKLRDPVLQRQGLEAMLASGKTDPAMVGQFQFFVGNLALNARDYAAARTALQAAIAAGHTADNPELLIANSYFGEGNHAQGLDYLRGAIEQRAAAGQAVDEAWLRRGLQVAYENRLADKAAEFSALHVKLSRSDRKWLEALQVVNALNASDKQVQLDLLRLMALTNSFSDRREYENYIGAADPRIMANEVARVLDAAVKAGAISTGDPYYAEVKSVVDVRGPEDRAEAPRLAQMARSGAAKDAENAGDVFLSLGSYAEAEEMFKLALEKGSADRDKTLTRLGIAQVHQGKHAEAKATFGQIGGARAVVARMWSAYVDTRA